MRQIFDVPVLLLRTIDRTALGISQEDSDRGRQEIEDTADETDRCKWHNLDSYEVSTDNSHLSVDGLIDLGIDLVSVI